MFFARSPSITPERAAARLTRGELVLVDVRQPAELRARPRARRRQHPLTQLPGRIDELDSGRPVAFLCHSGQRSSRATRIAIKAGHDAVNVRGGVRAWAAAGLPLTR